MNTTPGAAFHDTIGDADVIARAARVRARDRRWARRLIRLTLALFAVVVVGSMAFPYGLWPPPQCRSKQSEARGNLKALAVAQQSYRAEHDRYSDDVRALGWRPRGERVRYDYFVRLKNLDDADPVNDGFDVWAVGMLDEVAGDLWRDDENMALHNVVNACTL
jgi:hypothetical protein